MSTIGAKRVFPDEPSPIEVYEFDQMVRLEDTDPTDCMAIIRCKVGCLEMTAVFAIYPDDAGGYELGPVADSPGLVDSDAVLRWLLRDAS